MAIPPFNDLRLNPGEEKDPRRLRELFEGMTRNFEDLYNRYATGAEVRETVATKPLTVGVVSALGAITAGSGFTVEHPAAGRYIVKLKSASSTLLAPVTTLLEPPTTNLEIELLALTKQQFEVKTVVILGALTNSAFTFHVKPS